MADKIHSVPYNPVDYLQTPEDCAYYLEAALDEGDERVLSMALRNVAHTLGVSVPNCEYPPPPDNNLSRSPNETNQPRLGNLLHVLHVLGYELSVRPRRVA